MRLVFRIVDVLLAPFVVFAAILLKAVRKAGLHRLVLSRHILRRVGLFPIRDHYYEPFVRPADIRRSLDQKRDLPGIDFNVAHQLSTVGSFHFSDELRPIPTRNTSNVGGQFYFDNPYFGRGDAEYLYSFLRTRKPRRLIEIGSGFSTLMARKAIDRNGEEDPEYMCEHVCIEPFAAPWLENSGARVIRRKVEDVSPDLFRAMESGDILFIDSSHVIRPQGDVVLEYLTILPGLARGVSVHIHDIFSPRDYPASWVLDEGRLWNEQYLLEAFLTENHDWRVIGALNLLFRDHFEELAEKLPHLTRSSIPASFYIEKVG